MYKLLTLQVPIVANPNHVAISPAYYSDLVEFAGLSGLLDLLSVDPELRALVLAYRLGVGLLWVDPELAIGLAWAGKPLAIRGVGAVVVQVDLVLLRADQGKRALRGSAGCTRRGQGQEAISCAGNIDVCFVLRDMSVETIHTGEAGWIMRGCVVYLPYCWCDVPSLYTAIASSMRATAGVAASPQEELAWIPMCQWRPRGFRSSPSKVSPGAEATRL